MTSWTVDVMLYMMPIMFESRGLSAECARNRVSTVYCSELSFSSLPRPHCLPVLALFALSVLPLYFALSLLHCPTLLDCCALKTKELSVSSAVRTAESLVDRVSDRLLR